jgi:predicted dehydrogenase
MRRRDFIKNSALAGVAAGLVAPVRVSGADKNDRLQIGVIGCNGMGWSNAASLLKMNDVDVVAICDVDHAVIERRLNDYRVLRDNRPAVYGDYRELVEQADIDAVVIGTPDHWHCRQMVDAVEAGKHVYVEKPVANSIEECQVMLEAATASGKVVQTGQWQRSGHFRWFWDYAGGLMTDWGVHEIDIALWVLGATTPRSVMASGSIAQPNDAAETPNTLQAVFEYPRFNILWEHATGIDLGSYRLPEGIAFIGNNGTLVVHRGGFAVYPEREFVGWGREGPLKMEPIEGGHPPEGVSYLDLHTRNFIDAVKVGDPKLLNTPIESGSLAAINAQMGNIAYRTGDKILWNEETGAFVDNPAANELARAHYHNGWTIPGE